MIILPVGIQLKPPLLQMYILPSGPSAAPLGPPGISATTSLRPSGQTRVSRRPRISTSTTDPSGITTGPSGNSRSVASTRTSDMKSSRLFLGAGGFQARTARATISLRDVMAKTTSLAKQSGGMRLCKASQRRGLESLYDAFSSREPVPTSLENALLLHRYPDFEAAIAGERIEILVVTLEEGRVGR